MPEFELPLIKTIKEAADVHTFRFAYNNFKYEPGQYIILNLDVNDPKGNTRQFTMSSSPTEEPFISISTKISDSPFKRKLISLKEGDKVKISGPFGRFTLQNYSRHSIMIAGGIGITPFRSMLRFITDRDISNRAILLYSNKIPEEIAFKEELEEITKINPRVKIIFTITRPEESKIKWNGLTSRIDENMIKANLEDIKNSIFYICGPPTMVDGMVSILQDMKIPNEQIKVERFIGY